MKKNAFILVAVFITSFSLAQTRSIEFEHGTFDEVLAKAKKENKMVFVDCYTTWCGPCKWMAKNVFTNDTAADFYNKNFINAKIDMEKGEGIEIAKKYGIRAYPTLIYLSSEGTQLHRICGSGSVASFVADGQDALSPEKQFATAKTNFDKKKDVSAAWAFFSLSEKACQKYDTEINSYFASLKETEWITRGNWDIIYQFVTDYHSPVFQTFESSMEKYKHLYGADSVESKANHVYGSGLWSAAQNKNMAEYAIIKAKLQKSKTNEAETILFQSEIALYQQSQDWKQYALTVSDYILKCKVENPGELNSFAWAFYENIDDKKMLEKAEAWAKKATELYQDWAFFDTYAAIQFKLGKKADAEKNAKKAIELAKISGADYKETELLLEKINALK